MVVHLKKLCVGCDELAALKKSQHLRMQWAESNRPWHDTRHRPRLADEIKMAGSLYWVIKGSYAARQIIVDFTQIESDDGRTLCRMFLNPELIRVVPRKCRPFQGWRYLQSEEAPRDLVGDATKSEIEEDKKMIRELTDMGLL